MSSVQNTAPFGAGPVTLPSSLTVVGAVQLQSGAVAGNVLTSDASGNATWQNASSAVQTLSSSASGPWASPIAFNVLATKTGRVVTAIIPFVTNTATIVSNIAFSFSVPTTAWTFASGYSANFLVPVVLIDNATNATGYCSVSNPSGTTISVTVAKTTGAFAGAGNTGIQSAVLTWLTN